MQLPFLPEKSKVVMKPGTKVIKVVSKNGKHEPYNIFVDDVLPAARKKLLDIGKQKVKDVLVDAIIDGLNGKGPDYEIDASDAPPSKNNNDNSSGGSGNGGGSSNNNDNNNKSKPKNKPGGGEKSGNKRKSTYKGKSNSNGGNSSGNGGGSAKKIDFSEDFYTGKDTSSSLYLINGTFLQQVAHLPALGPDGKQEKSVDPEMVPIFDLEFSRVISDYRFKIQSNNTYDTSKNINDKTIINYMQTLSSVLQVYFFLDSTVKFTNKYSNKNRGLYEIRSRITAQDLDLLKQIEIMLERFYLPPNYVNFLRVMCGNFSSNEAAESPIIKICPNYLFLDDVNNTKAFVPDKTLRTLLFKLRTLSYANSLVGSIDRSWGISLDNDLNYFEKKYDRDFLSFWHNLNIPYLIAPGDMNFKRNSREVKGLNEPFYIGCFSNRVSVNHLASFSLFDSYIQKSQPGLFCVDQPNMANLDDENQSGLVIFDSESDQFIGLRTIRQANSSFVFATPYVDEGDYEVSINDFQSKEIRGRNLYTFYPIVKESIDYLFL